MGAVSAPRLCTVTRMHTSPVCLRDLDHDVEVATLVKDARVEQLLLRPLPPFRWGSPPRADRTGILGLRILIQIP